ncbi:hypothetical protein [Providencia hangzhouensis]|uniref:hypothetical protein n=1 Tax=Providencia hangzhouensis TaxID=3031799 RepID=UPI0034DDA76D
MSLAKTLKVSGLLLKILKITFGGKNYVGTDKEFLGTTGTASNIGIQIKDFKF